MGVNHGSAVSLRIKRHVNIRAKSLDLKRYNNFLLRKREFARSLNGYRIVFPSLELLMEPVRTGLRQIMSDLLRARPAEEAVVLAWPLVCGKEVATRTQAVSFANGTLTVEVADVNWRNQLQSFVPKYLSGYEGLLGQVVKSIRLE
jgi:hypothetical protein